MKKWNTWKSSLLLYKYSVQGFSKTSVSERYNPPDYMYFQVLETYFAFFHLSYVIQLDSLWQQ